MKTSFFAPMAHSQYWTFRHHGGIDLGTSNSVIIDSVADENGSHFPFEIPSIVAFHKKKNRVIAIGHEAKQMMGRVSPAEIEIIHPIKGGIISNRDFTASLVSRALKMSKRRRLRDKCGKFLFGVPLGTGAFNLRELEDVAFRCAHASHVYIASQPTLAAIGAGKNVLGPKAILVIDVGAGTTDIALLAYGSVAYGMSILYAGNDVDQAFIDFAKGKGLILGPQRAENLKISLSPLNGSDPTTPIPAQGRMKPQEIVNAAEISASAVKHQIQDGNAAQVLFELGELDEVLQQCVNTIVEALMKVLSDTPAELAELTGDLMEVGILLTGGGSQLRGLKEGIEELGFKVEIARDPLHCVARGIQLALQDDVLLEAIAIHSKTNPNWWE